MSQAEHERRHESGTKHERRSPENAGVEKSESESEVPHPRYEACDPIEAGCGSDVVDPWVRGKYPVSDDPDVEDGVIRTKVNYYAVQHDDGSGVVMTPAGGAVYAVRLADGTILGNESRGLMWPYGSETEDEAEAYAEIPFRFVGDVVAEQTRREVTDEGRTLMRSLRGADILDDHHDEEGVLLTHESGLQVYVGWDSTSYENSDLFGFVPFDGEDGVPVPSAGDALDLLKPHEAVARKGGEVTRQGEWFLVDTGEEPEGSIQKPGVSARPYGGSPLESHVPRDWATGVEDGVFLERARGAFDDLPVDVETPQGVFDWLHAEDPDPEDGEFDFLTSEQEALSEEIDAMYETARELADGIYVRGSFRHRDGEHYMETVDGWRRAETHEWDVITTDGRQVMHD